jgi:dienelactone hydrolase
VASITYASPRGGEVPALLVVPRGRGPFPGVIPQQGTIRGDLSLTPKDRDEQIQLIVDLRRAVDLLIARPDVNTAQLAYVGISYGAAMGGCWPGSRIASPPMCWPSATAGW